MPKNKTMRITSGALVRRRFLIPAMVDEGTVRPTPDRVREAIFSMLGHRLRGARVLDLFAGSGAHSYEAISRGALSATLVEKDARVVKVIKDNAHQLGIASKCHVFNADAFDFIKREPEGAFDIIFVDPPYVEKLPIEFFHALLKLLAEDGLVVFRCHKKESPALPQGLCLERDRAYGGTRVFFLRAS